MIPALLLLVRWEDKTKQKTISIYLLLKLNSRLIIHSGVPFLLHTDVEFHCLNIIFIRVIIEYSIMMNVNFIWSSWRYKWILKGAVCRHVNNVVRSINENIISARTSREITRMEKYGGAREDVGYRVSSACGFVCCIRKSAWCNFYVAFNGCEGLLLRTCCRREVTRLWIFPS